MLPCWPGAGRAPPPERPRPELRSPPPIIATAHSSPVHSLAYCGSRIERVPNDFRRVDEVLLVLVGEPLPVEWKLGRRALRSVGKNPIDVVVLAAHERDRAVGEHRPRVLGRHGLHDTSSRRGFRSPAGPADSCLPTSDARADDFDLPRLEIGSIDQRRIGDDATAANREAAFAKQSPLVVDRPWRRKRERERRRTPS